jgi:hypothetical protein
MIVSLDLERVGGGRMERMERNGCVPFQEKVSLVRSLTVVSPLRCTVSAGEGRGEYIK